MIFVPEKEKCIIWNDTPDEFIYILYEYNKDIKISFKWIKNKDNDPFYIQLEGLTIFKDVFDRHSLRVLNCVEPACECQPQLRYNKIINKWFCMCASSMICTKNDDKDELEHPDISKHFKENTLNEENGYFDNPVDAILNWNKSIAEFYFNECKELMKYEF